MAAISISRRIIHASNVYLLTIVSQMRFLYLHKNQLLLLFR